MLMDTGGNAGSQSSTLIIRAMALGDMTARDDVLALGKELLTSLLCGVGLGAVNFARMLLISRDNGAGGGGRHFAGGVPDRHRRQRHRLSCCRCWRGGCASTRR